MEWSVGVFKGEIPIAFIMQGVRIQDGKTVVYNAGTGVLPEYRGQGLVAEMHDYLLPLLMEKQVSKMVLEVIETNQSAIRAYEKNGFSINRKLLCFGGEVRAKDSSNAVSIQALNDFSWDVFQSFWDIIPGWQSAKESMDVVQPKALGAFIEDQLVGYALFSPTKKRLYQISVAPDYRRNGIATKLLTEIKKQMPPEKVQMMNVDEAAENLKLFLEKQGLVNEINQFEMIKEL